MSDAVGRYCEGERASRRQLTGPHGSRRGQKTARSQGGRCVLSRIGRGGRRAQHHVYASIQTARLIRGLVVEAIFAREALITRGGPRCTYLRTEVKQSEVVPSGLIFREHRPCELPDIVVLVIDTVWELKDTGIGAKHIHVNDRA